MTKIAKKIMLIFCSFIFVVCLGAGGVLGWNTNKAVEAKAAGEPTVEFTGFGTHNNTAWNDSFDAVDLKFSGDFTAATSSITSGNITYTYAGSTTANSFPHRWANINGCGSNVVELLCAKGAMTNGTVLKIEEGTVIGGQTLPGLTFILNDGVWTNQPTVEFTDFGTHNNTAWNDSFDAVDLKFSGDFTAATQALTSGSITYTKPGESPAKFQYYWANINGCGTNVVELLCWKGAMTNGTVLKIEEGTIIGGQMLPGLTFILNDGAWTNEPTVEFTDFDTHNNTAWNDSFDAVDLAFSGDFTAATQALTSGSITYTKPGESPAEFQYYWANINGCGTNVVELLCWKGAIVENTVLNIQGGTVIGGQMLPELTFTLTDGAWVKTETGETDTTASFKGIVEGYNWVVNSSDRRALVLEFDQTINPNASGNISELDGTDGNSVKIQLNGQDRNKNNLLARSRVVISDNSNAIELVFKTYENTSGTVYADGVVSPLADGTKLEIKDSTVNGYVIKDVTLYFNATTQKWQDTAPTEEPEATESSFASIDAGNNNVTGYTSGYQMVRIAFTAAASQTGIEASDTYELGNSLKLNGVAVNELGWLISHNANSAKVNFEYTSLPAFSASLTQIKLELTSATVFGDIEIQPFTLYFNGTTWQTEEYTYEDVPVETVTFVKIDETINYYDNGGGYYLTDLKFNFDTTQNQFYMNFGTPEAGYEDLGTKIYWTEYGSTTKNAFNIVFGVNGNIRLMDAAARYPSPYSTIHIEEGTVIEGRSLPAVTLYVGADGKWTTEDPGEPAVEFVKIDETINYYTSGDGYYLTDLKFNFNTTQNQFYTYFGTPEAGYEDLGTKIYWTAYDSTTKNSFYIVFGINGNIRLMDTAARYPSPYSTIHIEEGTVIEGRSLPAVTLYVGADGKWTTEEQTPPEMPKATFDRVAGADMSGTVWGMHSMLYLKFDIALAPTTTSIHGNVNANNSGNLKDKMTINGNAIAMGSQINFYVNAFYSAEGENTTVLEIMFANSNASTYAKGTVLYIPEGTLFGDVALSEVTLTYNGTAWLDESKLTSVEFVEIDANRNNNNVWGMNYVTILYFDKPLYEGVMDTVLAEQVAGDLGAKLTLNGVTAKELGVAITFASLSAEGRYGLEIHIPVANMLKFSEELTQIILKIEEDTIFLNNILPELSFYLNESSKWQTDEFTYVYVPPMEVELVGINFRYNNDNNTWQKENDPDREWYLTVFEFSDYVTKTEIKGSALPLGDKITLNGVKVSELEFLFGIGAYNTTMNVQYPKEVLLSLLDEPRIELALSEPIEYGDVIIKPFKLYLHKQSVKWELIDGTDTTAPELTYTGATEITTSEGKPFVIDVSAFDNEDNKAATVYYDWSEGAVDADGKLLKGTHTCTVVAVDMSGNETKLTLSVTVGDKDTVAPVITVADTISAVQGAMPVLTYKATDNTDGEILCKVEWSEGALDANGKLVAGTHTMTLTATDLTGNFSTKTVTVNVAGISIDDLADEKEDANAEEVVEQAPETEDSSSSDASANGNTVFVGCDSSVGGCAAAIALAVLCAFVLRKRKVK